MTNTTAPWSQLEAAAAAALSKAYAPYSNFRVGAAALTGDGRLVSGCNIENAAFGVTLCAECSMLGELFATGGGTLDYFVCFGQLKDGELELITPCGRCRQLLFEHRGPDLRIKTASGIVGMDQLLPDAFGPHNIID
ncbi:cytidine deaminase [Glutamicibacter protophormiae]|uniref:cytidine deaminase n=1 Tax=Glutamicibacter protophormiae TaxID=37930 RepID=UPI002A83A805|nr:cytidine deaminase [Glutamicibacter protophormiae]WPR65474.1 cytidine deaminase [Glutamicibacter protophormiae]WPR68972.1 cytidine deaminase [Glutamicibacter protophormiae]